MSEPVEVTTVSCLVDTVSRLRARIAELEKGLTFQRDRAERHLKALAKAEAERDEARAYSDDLEVVRKRLDECDAPHDCEDHISLPSMRVRLLADQRDFERARAERYKDAIKAMFAAQVGKQSQWEKAMADLSRIAHEEAGR